MSRGVKSTGFPLGKSSRDLACQSADRWRSQERDAGVQNFELHAFRAAFQMVLFRYYPEVIKTSPSVGRQGKAMRRQHQRRILESQLHVIDHTCPSSDKHFNNPTKCKTDDKSVSILGMSAVSHENSFNRSTRCEYRDLDNKYLLFEKFCLSGLCRLDLKTLDNLDLRAIWEEVESFVDIIGPYWSIRAALGPLLETYILLDRLLFLQEQDSSLEAVMLPIFDPVLSPRNVAIIAKKTKS